MKTDEVLQYLDEIDAHKESANLQAGHVAALEQAADAVAFMGSLHEAFRDNGMTQTEEPDPDELENLIDALHGELGAAVLFLCHPAFSRVPDMLRALDTEEMEKNEVPVAVIRGFARLAQRIENTRVNMQKLAREPETA